MSDWCVLHAEWRKLHAEVERLLEEVRSLEGSTDLELLGAKTQLLIGATDAMHALVGKLHQIARKTVPSEAGLEGNAFTRPLRLNS